MYQYMHVIFMTNRRFKPTSCVCPNTQDFPWLRKGVGESDSERYLMSVLMMQYYVPARLPWYDRPGTPTYHIDLFL